MKFYRKPIRRVLWENMITYKGKIGKNRNLISVLAQGNMKWMRFGMKNTKR